MSDAEDVQRPGEALGPASDGPAELDTVVIEAALGRILASRLFLHAPRQARFLGYVVRETLAGSGDRLNQHAIAQDVFDRDETFDPAADSIVRVEAGRLRARLREYYDDVESDATVRITVPKRGYSANFSVPDQLEKTTESGVVGRSVVIAVLRFENMSPDPDDTYFADGLTEDLITDLARLPGLEVISRNSTFTVSNTSVAISETSRLLGANYVVEGSVRRVGSRVRINAQLIDGARDVHLWAERYDYDYEDIFSLQDDVVGRIAAALRLRLPVDDSPAQESALSAAAKELVYRARACERLPGRDNHLQAMSFYEAAMEIDASYAVACARAADNAVFQWIFRYRQDRESTLAKGLTLAERAVSLDPQLALGHAARSFASIWSGNIAEAQQSGTRALEVDGSDIRALMVMTLVSAWSREFSDAERYVSKLEQLEPTQPHNFARGVMNFMAADYDAAINCLEPLSRKAPRFIPIWLYLGASYHHAGAYADARNAVSHLREVNPEFTTQTANASDRLFANFKYDSDRDRFLGALIESGL